MRKGRAIFATKLRKNLGTGRPGENGEGAFDEGKGAQRVRGRRAGAPAARVRSRGISSDFYAAYDALPCPQQKCLIHLLRDMNQELLSNPFDAELQSITAPFGTLLRAAVEEVDRHGLKARYLGRQERATVRFFDDLAARSFGSEAAEALRARLLKYRDKLFTFLRHDGVAWNNNTAENAIKQFAYYREGTVGVLREAGLADYLVLLSIYQTCRYRGVSFLKFLLSRERDVDAFCEHPRRKRRGPPIEVYP